MFRRLRKRYLCWRYGICPVHNVMRPHGGYNGKWDTCPTCQSENAGKNHQRNTRYEAARDQAVERINQYWRGPAPTAPPKGKDDAR